jgi:prepilin-type N-terminal cleavage/methylation domain-containing protein
MYKKTARRKSARAFSLVEMLMSLLIIGILGFAIVATLWLVTTLFSQTEDYTSAHQEIEHALHLLGGQITNAGLAMPNNKMLVGSFASAFDSTATPPVMALMGAHNEDWGGPVTLATGLALGGSDFVKSKSVTLPGGEEAYGGTVLYYAWSIPTGIHIRGVHDPLNASKSLIGEDIEKNMGVKFQLNDTADMTKLETFTYEGRQVGLSMQDSPNASLASTRRWITFPTLRVPFWVSGWNKNGTNMGNGSITNNSITTSMAPGSAVEFRRIFANYEEIHLVQACRLYLDNGTLVQEFFDTGYASDTNRVRVDLASGIAELYFTFNPVRRLLTMYIAARGSDPLPIGTSAVNLLAWPNYIPATIASADLRYRLLMNTVTWRIRN